MKVRRIVSHSPREIVAEVDVAADAVSGKRDIAFRRSVLQSAIAVYDRVERGYARLIGRIPQIRALPASPDTFPIRFPDHGARWEGGRYVFAFAWNEIASFDITMFALVIEMRSGARLLLRRFYFLEGISRHGHRVISNEYGGRLKIKFQAFFDFVAAQERLPAEVIE